MWDKNIYHPNIERRIVSKFVLIRLSKECKIFMHINLISWWFMSCTKHILNVTCSALHLPANSDLKALERPGIGWCTVVVKIGWDVSRYTVVGGKWQLPPAHIWRVRIGCTRPVQPIRAHIWKLAKLIWNSILPQPYDDAEPNHWHHGSNK